MTAQKCYILDRYKGKKEFSTIKEMCAYTVPRVTADGYSRNVYSAVSDECIGSVRVNPRGVYKTRARMVSGDRSKLSARFIRRD